MEHERGQFQRVEYERGKSQRDEILEGEVTIADGI
jgi:hypothetical protein